MKSIGDVFCTSILNSLLYDLKIMSLTNEGGRLKRDVMLVRGKDFELVPEAIWRALSAWYGATTALPRTVSH
jgi:ubiquitin carboxyl-terminal hydrolase 6/32